jgi:hypothetical protein
MIGLTYISIKEGCLFLFFLFVCHVKISQTKTPLVLLLALESPHEGCLELVHNVWTYSGKINEY